MYEGYGPAGVAMLIECLTDNKNRAAMEVRTAMTRNGGSLADPGSVSFLFNRKGVVIVPVDQDGRTVSEDDVLEATLDAGAEEVNDLGESFEVVSEATDLVAVRTALQAAGIDYDSAEAEFVPDLQVQLDKDRRRQGVPPDRGARGLRRRPERLRQLRRLRRGAWPSSTPDLFGGRGARAVRPEPRNHEMACRAPYDARPPDSVRTNTCSDGERKATACACWGSTRG